MTPLVPYPQMPNKSAVAVSASLVGGISDLVAEILHPLPIKTLITFKVVSKQFHNIISSPSFCLRHFRSHSNQPKTPSGLYFYNTLTDSQESLSFSLTKSSKLQNLPSLSYLYSVAENTGSALKILNSANGVLLCCFRFDSKLCIDVVTNPVTRGMHIVPYLSNDFYHDESEVVIGAHVVFDDVVSDRVRVFGIKNGKDPVAEDDCFRVGPCVVYRYCLESERWEGVCNFELSMSKVSVSGVYWNGGIHWIGGNSSLHYDIKANKVKTRPMPPKPHGREDGQKIRYFGESGGHLHLIQMGTLKAVKFNVLELDKKNWKWVVKYRVNLSPVMKVFPGLVKVNKLRHIQKHTFLILGVVREENEDNSALVLAIPGKVIAVNLNHKRLMKLCELPGEICEDFRFIPVSSFQYTETLFPVLEVGMQGK